MELMDAGTLELGQYPLKQVSLLSLIPTVQACPGRPGDILRLAREVDDNRSANRVSAYWRGQGTTEVRLGVLDDERLARHLDGAGQVEARLWCGQGKLAQLTQRLVRMLGIKPRLQVEIRWGDSDWSRLAPVVDRSNSIGIKIEQANHLRKREPQQAVALYQDAISDLFDLHFEFPEARSWRRIHYPVNELAGLLEQLGDIRGAYQVIRDYEGFADDLGLAPKQRQILRDLKFRLEKRQIFANQADRRHASVARLVSRKAPAICATGQMEKIAR